MVCTLPQPIFPSPWWRGLKQAKPQQDGYTVMVAWSYASPSSSDYSIGYNVYFSTNKEDVFTEGPKYFTEYQILEIARFTPGDVWYFASRAMEYDPDVVSPTSFPVASNAENGYVYPETALVVDINDSQLTIPVVDASEFPSYGIVVVGAELIRYSSIDYVNNIINATSDGRGYYSTNIRYHQVDGYDGYNYQDPVIRHYWGFEDDNTTIVEAEPRVEYPEYPYVESDGYRQTTTDLLTTSLAASDESNIDFQSYDYSSYHQTNMLDYFSGHCIGSYHGGEYGCADGYKYRGVNVQSESNKRLEMLLDVTGEPVVLLRRLWTGIRCKCFRMNQEAPEGRCGTCFGTSFVGGYDQYFNPRRTDGRLMMRFEPVQDDLAIKPHGLQQNFVPNCWTLVVPAIKDRDVLIRFNEDGTEEFRYEVVNVTRNKLLFSLSGAQKMQVYRLDRTDIIYQWRAVRSTADAPVTYNTTAGILRGYGPHYHTITVSGTAITSISQVNGTTSVVAGHNHTVINGVIDNSTLGHSHSISF